MSDTRVVSIRHEPYDVYIGRAGKGKSGFFGNPFTVREHGHGALMLYGEHFVARIKADREFREMVLSLQGLRLGCFCAPLGGLTAADKPYRCHGQIIAAWVDSQPEVSLPGKKARA